MRLTSRGSPPPPSDDLARAIANAAEHLGHRPAITVVRAHRRDEQGFMSLAQWTAKGAHLLHIEAGLAPGDRLRLLSPPGWIGAAVCTAAWWAGVAVTDAPGAPVTVVHESVPAPGGGGSYVIGDEFDGSPVVAGAAEPWALAVQSFPDRPPPPAAHAGAIALERGERTWSHAQMIAAAAEAPSSIAGDAPAEVWILAVARVLVTGEALTIA